MKLTIILNTKNRHDQKSLIRSIPEILYGNSEQICWLVAQEVHHNFIKKARNRLIRLWRSNLSDIETEKSIYKLLLSFITSSRADEHPFFSESCSKVNHAVAITIKYGKSIETKFIDLEDYEESPLNFINLNSEYGKKFFGKSVGETISFTDNLGVPKQYEILAIKPFILNIWETLSNRVHEIDNPFDFMTSIETDLDSEEGYKKFFDTFKVMQDKRHAFFQNCIDNYNNHPLTFHRFSKYLSISVVELVYQWHNNFNNKIYSIDDRFINNEAEYIFLEETIKNLDKVIIDLYSLIELKFFNKLDVLERFEEVYISKVNYADLQDLIDLQKREMSDEKKGTLQVMNGVPRFIEHDRDNAKKILIDLQEILDFIDNKNFVCEASYGDGHTHELDDVLANFLTTSENSTIRLAREKKIPVCSFDARLRALIHQYGMETINLDDLVINNSELSKKIFPFQKFVHNRT
ncbi:PIN domain-containing protein, partial [Acinetobacter soli]|uniref:PIN domain-containing protein n=1 Tax=Acinetobacter soli TaxID=487316 RepID=UPI00125CE173